MAMIIDFNAYQQNAQTKTKEISLDNTCLSELGAAIQQLIRQLRTAPLLLDY